MRSALLLGVAMAALLSGCVSVETATPSQSNKLPEVLPDGSTREHIHISNYGYYLFNSVPLISGDTDQVGKVGWFEDDVRLNKLQRILVDEAKKRGADIAEVQPYTYSTCCFASIPYVGSTLGLVWYKEVQLSVVLVKKPQATTTKEIRK